MKNSVGIFAVMSVMCACFVSCRDANEEKSRGVEEKNREEKSVYVPKAPAYEDELMWYVRENDTEGDGADVFYAVSTWEVDWKTENGEVCHWADVWKEKHRDDMTIEIAKAAEYMADGNNFYAPFYRHTTIEAWETQNEDTIHSRTRIAMEDIINAFDHFNAKRDKSRPFILAGFSQGGLAVVEILKHLDAETAKGLVGAYVLGYKVTPSDTMECANIRAAKDSVDVGVTVCYNTVKDVKYVSPVVSVPCAMCINPVNWRTDSVSAVLHDTISVVVSPSYNVLVVSGYSGSEYHPIRGFLNVGDIHSCEPWLYSECLRMNFKVRTKAWRAKNK